MVGCQPIAQDSYCPVECLKAGNHVRSKFVKPYQTSHEAACRVGSDQDIWGITWKAGKLLRSISHRTRIQGIVTDAVRNYSPIILEQIKLILVILEQKVSILSIVGRSIDLWSLDVLSIVLRRRLQRVLYQNH